MDAVLDSAPMVQTRADQGGNVCCILCLRQFKSTQHIMRHLAKSTLHAKNLAAATAAGRVQQPASDAEPHGAGTKRTAAAMSGEAPPATTGVSRGLSALQQMELFEKRLKTQRKNDADVPDGPLGDDRATLNSTHARTINGQMDWECGHCAPRASTEAARAGARGCLRR